MSNNEEYICLTNMYTRSQLNSTKTLTFFYQSLGSTVLTNWKTNVFPGHVELFIDVPSRKDQINILHCCKP